MKPIATYTERLLEVRRDFSLYDDRMVVEARWLIRGRFQTVVKLDSLKADTRVIIVRYRLYRYAGWILAIGLMILAMAFYNAQGGAMSLIGRIALGVAMIGAVSLAFTYPHRRIHFVRFDAISGTGGLDIGAAGSNARVFETFVDRVTRQIRKQNRLSTPF